MRLKSYLTAAAVILSFHSAFSQASDASLDDKKFYLRVFGSYGFLTSGSFKAPASQSTVSQNGVSTYGFKAQKTGMGAGFRFGAGVGFVINKAINIGLDGEYLMGTNLNSSSSTQTSDAIRINLPLPTSPPNATATTNATETYQLQHTIISIIPNITFKAITTETYYIYTRVGIIVGIPQKITVSDVSHSLYITTTPDVTPAGYNYYKENTSDAAYKYKSNPGIGYQAALGIAFAVTNSIRFYAEAVSNSLTLHPVEYDETSHTTTTLNKYYGGADQTTVDHILNIQQFKQSGTSAITYTGTAPNQVAFYQSPQISMAINSLNFGLGIIVKF